MRKNQPIETEQENKRYRNLRSKTLKCIMFKTDEFNNLKENMNIRSTET